MPEKPKIIAIFIALNAEKTLKKVYDEFPQNLVNDIILFDDHSDDNTFVIAKKLGIKSYRNKIRLGYGGNIKLALSSALKNGADIIIDLHPDGEYKPGAIAKALEKVKLSNADLVLGNRFTKSSSALNSGMYIWKFVPIYLLNKIDRILLGINIHDFHQGFRVYTKELLKGINFEKNSDDYLFSFELIAQAVFKGFKIEEVPVETNYTGKKRGASLKNSLKYSFGTCKVLILFFLAKLGFNIKLFGN